MNLGAFHRRDGGHAKGSLLSVSRVGLPLTPPTRCPQAGDTCSMGLASIDEEQAPRRFERAVRLYNLVESTRFRDCARLGLTTQARQRGSVCVAFRES